MEAMMRDADRELKSEALAGGERAREAFAGLWRTYHRRLFIFSLSFRGLPAGDREDAVADSLVTAFSRIADYDPERPLAAWVYAIARNRFIDAARRAARFSARPLGSREEASGGIEPRSEDDPAAAALATEAISRLRSILARLPEQDRLIAQLRFYEELPAVEIAAALGMPAGTLRWRIHRLRRFLAKELGEES